MVWLAAATFTISSCGGGQGEREPGRKRTGGGREAGEAGRDAGVMRGREAAEE